MPANNRTSKEIEKWGWGTHGRRGRQASHAPKHVEFFERRVRREETEDGWIWQRRNPSTRTELEELVLEGETLESGTMRVREIQSRERNQTPPSIAGGRKIVYKWIIALLPPSSAYHRIYIFWNLNFKFK